MEKVTTLIKKYQLIFIDMNLSPQQLEIYLLLKENKGRETGVSEFVQRDGLNIASYTERISELRQKGFGVLSTRKNYYVLVSEPEPTIEDLRFVYVEAKRRGYKSLMERCIKKAQDFSLTKLVQDTLIK